MKILFFDYWLKGIANFNRLAPAILAECGDAEIKMLHTGSWKEAQPQINNHHQGFESFDISYYHTSSLYKVLKREKPDVLVMLNIYLLLDKALIAYCKHLGIKTVFLAHGRLSGGEATTYSANTKKSLADKFKKEPLLTLYNYALASLRARKPLRIFHTVRNIIKHKFNIAFPAQYSEELEADEIMVFYDSDRQLLHRDKKFPLEKIKVVGNPELDNFVNQPVIARDEFMVSSGISGPYLLYLDDGWVEANLIKKENFEGHLRQLAELAAMAGLQMVIKLHPRTPQEDYTSLFEELQIKAFKSEVDFKSLIQHSYSVTSLASTTISMALFLRKRVISPRFGSVKDVFRNYPDDVIHYSETVEDFKKWLDNDLPTVTNQKYLDDNFRMCDGLTLPRIARGILACSDKKFLYLHTQSPSSELK